MFQLFMVRKSLCSNSEVFFVIRPCKPQIFNLSFDVWMVCMQKYPSRIGSYDGVDDGGGCAAADGDDYDYDNNNDDGEGGNGDFLQTANQSRGQLVNP